MNKIIAFMNNGVPDIIYPGDYSIEKILKDHIPKGCEAFCFDSESLPDMFFIYAFDIDKNGIRIDLSRAKEYAHECRRVSRDNELTPLDLKISIPSESVETEIAREAVRAKYAKMQIDIDKAKTEKELKVIIGA